MKELWEIFGGRPDVSARAAGLPISEAAAAIWAAWRMDDGLMRELGRLAAWDDGWQMRDADEKLAESVDLAAVIGVRQDGTVVSVDGVARLPGFVGDVGGIGGGMAGRELGVANLARREKDEVLRGSYGGAADSVTESASDSLFGAVTVQGEMAGLPSFLMVGQDEAALAAGSVFGGEAARNAAAASAAVSGNDVLMRADDAVWSSLSELLPITGAADAVAERELGVMAAAGGRRGRAMDIAGESAADNARSVPQREAMAPGILDVAEVSRQVAEILSDELQVMLGGMSLFVR